MGGRQTATFTVSANKRQSVASGAPESLLARVEGILIPRGVELKAGSKNEMWPLVMNSRRFTASFCATSARTFLMLDYSAQLSNRLPAAILLGCWQWASFPPKRDAP